MVNLLTIEDSTIRAMIADPRVVALLPCLNGAKDQLDSIAKGGALCNTCKSKKKGVNNDAMRTAKSCVANLRGQRLNDLKNILNAKQLRVVAKNGGGKKVQFTL